MYLFVMCFTCCDVAHKSNIDTVNVKRILCIVKMTVSVSLPQHGFHTKVDHLQSMFRNLPPPLVV